jgi:death-on-curing protein
MKLIYFTSEYSIRIHDEIIRISGGKSGVKDFGNIDSPLTHIQNDDYYPGFENKLTHLVFSFIKFHAFNDGNKRTAIAMGAFFLTVNGLDAFVDKFIIEMENVAVTVAGNFIDKSLLDEIITAIINEEDYSEELKLKIVHALSQIPDRDELSSLGAQFYRDLY